VTTATDVYGLGLLLYELLIGHSPRSLQEKLGEGWSARPPSQTLAAFTTAGDAENRRLARRLQGDLDTIVGKALERDPERRYGTAAALAEDIERHLTQRPVSARRPTLAYRLGRTVLRHKLAATLILAVCLLAATSTSAFLVVRRERDRAEAPRQRAEALSDFLQSMIQKANPERSRGETLTVRQVLDAGSKDLMGRDSRYQPETWAALLETTGTIYQDLGLYEQARKNLERALLLREPLYAASRERDLALAGTLTALGNVSLDQQAYAESRGFFQRALTLQKRWLGPAALPLAQDLNGLGFACLEEGNLEEAGRKFDRACAIGRLAVENGSEDLADCYNNLGSLAVRREEFARARLLFSAAFRYYQSAYGEDHPETIRVRTNLGYILTETGDWAGAEAMYQKIADVRRRLLEPDHPDLARALLELAIVQHQGRRLAEARATLNELMQIRREYRFPRDQSEAEIWNLLGAVASGLKDLEAAEAAYARSYEAYRVLPGEHRADLSNILNGRARVRLLRNDPAGALEMARHSRELAQASDVRSGDTVARAEIVLGLCYLALGQPSRARPFLERSHTTLLDLYGPEYPATREAANVLRRLGAPAG
jgi:tetratricopeptide (TPR) repeat protein